MEITMIDALIVLMAITGIGIGLTLGFVAIRKLSKLAAPTAAGGGRNVAADKSVSEIEEVSSFAPSSSKGTQRTSQCLSLLGNGFVRLSSGGYLIGYRVKLEPSIWRDEPDVERIYEKIGRLLALQKPTGTVMQFRLAQSNDPGVLLKKQEEASPSEEIHEIAAALQTFERVFHYGMAQSGAFNRSVASFWINVPVKGAGDAEQNGLNGLWRAIKYSYRSGDWKNLFTFNNDRVVRRLVNDEREAFESAERTIRLIEKMSPLALERFDKDEIWQALYLGQNENKEVAPLTPQSVLTDLRPLLCGEKIDWDKTWYVLHGNTPVTMIALYRAPEEIQSPSLMRILSHNPTLTGRRTIITEYVQKSVRKTKAELKSQDTAIDKTSTTLKGGKEYTEEKIKAKQNVKNALADFTDESQGSLEMRHYILVYGERARTKKELQISLKELEQNCEKILAVLQSNFDGADFALVPPDSLRQLYERTLVGELKANKCGWEIAETGRNLSPFVPAETCWEGEAKPHSIYQTIGGKLTGINLFRNKLMGSPTVLVLGESRSGKSVLLLGLVTDVLAQIKKAQVCVIDFGKSFEPLCEVLGGEYHQFHKRRVETINIWDYEGLERGEMPDEVQRNFVVEDALILSNTKEGTKEEQMRSAVLRVCVDEVYANEVPYNRFATIKHEPTHSHLVNMLKSYPFEGEARRHADELILLLQGFCGHPWIDAPTCEKYRTRNRFVVFEMSSLTGFASEIRRCMSFRVAARVNSCIGRDDDGELLKTLLVLEEVHRLPENPDFKPVLRAQKKSVVEGGKEGVVTLIATQTYTQLEELHEIRAQAGAVFVAKQTELDDLIKDRTLGKSVAGAIRSVTKENGNYSQFVLNFGKGFNQQSEVVQLNLSPIGYWTRTSESEERNARALVKKLRPDWSMLQGVLWLAENYPKGLIRAGLDVIDTSLIPSAPLLLPTPPAAIHQESTQARELNLNFLDAGREEAEGESEAINFQSSSMSYPAETTKSNPDKLEIADLFGEAAAGFFDDPEMLLDEARQIAASKKLAAALGVDVDGAVIVGIRE